MSNKTYNEQINTARNLFADTQSQRVFQAAATHYRQPIEYMTHERWKQYAEEYKEGVRSGLYPKINFDHTDHHGISVFAIKCYSYEDKVNFESGDLLYDCGANSGAVSMLCVINGGKSLALEPHPETFKNLQKNSKEYEGITCVNCGVGEERAVRKFVLDTGWPSASHCSEHGELDIWCDTVDNLTKQYGIPTFIKIDTEGYELNILKGAKETIQKYKPKMAIALYHYPDHFWQIPALLKQYVPEYELYCKMGSVSECVLLATTNAPSVRDQTTIVTRIRNRNAILRHHLPKWLEYGRPIVIVDFRDEGCESAWDEVKKYDTDLVRVIETKYEYMFLPHHAWNLGIQQVQSEYALLLDIDDVLESNFFEENTPYGHGFYCGHGLGHLWGVCYAKKKHLDSVGGFNENMIMMGHGDEDLYRRLEKFGYTKSIINPATCRHVNHSRNLTIQNQYQDIKTLNEDGHHRPLWSKSSEVNFLISSYGWTADSNRTKWQLTELEPNRFLAVRTFGD